MREEAILTTGIEEHPASKCWLELGPNHAMPARIERLTRKKKSAVYRLVAAGPGGSDVIAKRCKPESAWVERAVYEEILPRLTISSLRYFGFAEVPNGDEPWLFVEDAGGKEHVPQPNLHTDLISRWLGLMHTETARLADAARLPERGPNHYLEHLRSARETILRNLGNPLLRAVDLAFLEMTVSHCDHLEARWNQIESFCGGMPQSLVHGDFVVKNMRVRTGQAGDALLLFDWETAGWGVPAADVSQLEEKYPACVDLTRYCSILRESWPHLQLPDVRQLASVGSLFRLLAMVHWESMELPYGSVRKSMGSMRVYQAEMARALRDAGFGETGR